MKLLLFLLLLIIVVRDHFEPQHIKTVAAINIVSMAYDIIWLSFYQVVKMCSYINRKSGTLRVIRA